MCVCVRVVKYMISPLSFRKLLLASWRLRAGTSPAWPLRGKPRKRYFCHFGGF